MDKMMVSLDANKWAYQDPEAGEATRVQFMSAIFEHVVYMFKDDPSDRVCLQVQAKRAGTYVKAYGVVDFLITRGKKSVCVVLGLQEGLGPERSRHGGGRG